MAENGGGTSARGGGAKKVMTMKLLVDNKSKKVLYGEAGKEVVDFLISLLTLPIGTVAKLLEGSDDGMVGCAAKIYNSVQTIDASYLHNDRDKNNLLLQLTSLPYPANSASSHLLLENKSSTPKKYLANSASSHLLLEHKSSTPKKYYQCSEVIGFYSSGRQFPSCNFKYVSDVYKAECPTCRQPMTKELVFVKGENNLDENESVKGGIVKGVVSYMVMDDLSISPLSIISGIGILNKFNVVIRDLEEKTVEIGMEEGLKLLKASLQSKTALSDVFMMKKETVDYSGLKLGSGRRLMTKPSFYSKSEGNFTPDSA